MRKRRMVCLAVMAVAFALLMGAQAQAAEVGVRAYVWFPSLSADARGNGGFAATTTNLTETLGLGNKAAYSAEIFGGMGKHHLSFMYTSLGYSDTKSLGSQVVFNGAVYNPGTGVNTELNLKMYDLKYQYDLVHMQNILAGFSLGPILQIKYLDGEMKLSGQSASTQPGNQKQSFQAPVPMIGLGCHANLIAKWLEARAQVTGMAYGGSLLIEGMADLSLTPFPFVDIHGGYKIMKLRASTNDFFLDSQFSGPYLALTVAF